MNKVVLGNNNLDPYFYVEIPKGVRFNNLGKLKIRWKRMQGGV
jgi:hypothetical protein